jgi:predicted DNA-binding transcriptional regulator YafY
MARGDQALRQWKILTAIMSRPRYGATQKQLLEEIEELTPRGKGKRTLQRDLRVLEQAGFPIDRSGRTNGGGALYKFLPAFQQIPPIMPTVQELIAISIARTHLSVFEGTPFKEDFDSFCKKAQAIFPDEALKELEETQSLYDTLDRPAMDFLQYKPLLKILNKAVTKRQRLKMLYYSSRRGRHYTYLIDPLMIFSYTRLLYLAAYVLTYKEVRYFSLDRIKELLPTGLIFPRRTYSLDEIKSEAFGIIDEEPFELVVRFNKAIADFVKRRIHHPSQRVESLPNGDLIMTIRAGGWNEMKDWVMGYFQHAEVLKPHEMREEIKKDLAQALDLYEE